MAESQLGDLGSSEARKDASSGSHPKPSRQEARTFLRFRVDETTANLSMRGFLTSLGLGRANKARAAINLSEGGVMLLTREKLPIGAKVTVRIEMERYSDVIETDGEVRWCAESARSGKDYYAGIQFTNLVEADLKKIGRMREWFLSPEFKARSITRRRSQPPQIETDR